jgi:ribonuclease J
MPLVNPDKTPFDSRVADSFSTDELIRKGILPDIPSLYEDNSKTALFISHAHRDHYGLINRVNPSCRIYLGFATQMLIETLNTFIGEKWTIRNAKHIEHDDKIEIGDMGITPYRMDHSAFDSYAFLIEADGKSLFYSGDFRLHGRESANFDWFCKNVRKNVDYLLMEGSTIGRTEEPFPTESELEEQFEGVFRQTKGIVLVHTSSHNIDRLVTLYNASIKCNRYFLVDFFTANVLKSINKRAKNESIPYPSAHNFPGMKVYYPQYYINRMNEIGKDAETIYRFSKYNKIGRDKLNDLAKDIVMLVKPSVRNDLTRYLRKYDDGCFIFSMWSGYKTQPGKVKDFLDFIASKGMPIKDIHTSGHADLSGLRRMVEAVSPKHLVPIHTFEGDKYAELFPGIDVRRVDDRETVEM